VSDRDGYVHTQVEVDFANALVLQGVGAAPHRALSQEAGVDLIGMSLIGTVFNLRAKASGILLLNVEAAARLTATLTEAVALWPQATRARYVELLAAATADSRQAVQTADVLNDARAALTEVTQDLDELPP